ncbi:erythromycin esterase family protein [Pelagicoccus sp. SDUM812005]|uniref:erythromycin esterase family protein n=1 Tax=Pelagicoccus sp. SDUM812005 TaxID=3041257 RepID=UPI002810999E|nr:erythromycin esterase family protein [Pelagicoccus sp. SDUM812005]MDQ8182005.1 erythromycin esterase family protein [Pelagicoccus sp. SDUM812005]
MRNIIATLLAALYCSFAGLSNSETVVPSADYSLPSLSQETLDRIGETIGNSRIVALGEATHGTKEETYLRAQIVKHLVTQKGFTILAIEDQVANAFTVNAQIDDVNSDADRMLRSLVFWPWHNKELAKLLKWAHENKTGQSPFNFRLMGFDTQVPVSGGIRLNPFIKETGIRFLSVGEKYNKKIEIEDFDGDPIAASDTVIEFIKSRALEEELLLCAHAIREHYLQRAKRQSREQGMANMVNKITDLNPNSKVIMWGHNVHFSKKSDLPNSSVESLGYHLSQFYGEDYFVLGLAVGSGTYRAIDLEAKKNQENEIPMPPQSSLESKLSGITETPIFIEKEDFPTEVTRQWLPGSMAHPKQFYDRDIHNDYDALLWIPHVTASEFIDYDNKE